MQPLSKLNIGTWPSVTLRTQLRSAFLAIANIVNGNVRYAAWRHIQLPVHIIVRTNVVSNVIRVARLHRDKRK